jgi:hypothetical protein
MATILKIIGNFTVDAIYQACQPFTINWDPNLFNDISTNTTRSNNVTVTVVNAGEADDFAAGTALGNYTST